MFKFMFELWLSNVNQLAQAVVYLICIVSGSDITSYFNNRLGTMAKPQLHTVELCYRL